MLFAGVSAGIWGLLVFRWRHLVCLPMSVLLPVSLIAQDATAAMLRATDNGVYVNENLAPSSIAVFPDDVIKTLKNVVASLTLAGSSAQISGESMLQFQPDELALDHGRVSVSTSRGLRVRVGCITITPVNTAEWTQYDVLDVDGKVTVNALKSDVYLDAHSKNVEPEKVPAQRDRNIVHEGEQKSRDEKCAAAYTPEQPAAGVGAAMNSLYTRLAAGAALGALICLGICHNDDPISPSRPK